MYFSAKESSFFPVRHADDAVEISDDTYQELIYAVSSGASIKSDEHGQPVAAYPQPPTRAAISHFELSRLITVASNQIEVVRPAVDGGYAKPEHVQLLADWQRYRYELMSVPEQPGWPESPQWPGQPETII